MKLIFSKIVLAEICHESSHPTLFFFLEKLFIYYWLHWVFIAVQGLSPVVASRGFSPVTVHGLLIQWLLLLCSAGSRHAGFSTCGTGAQQLWLEGLAPFSKWDLPGLKTEPVSPALAGGFLTAGPLGSPPYSSDYHKFIIYFEI